MTFEEEFPSIKKMFKEGTELTARTNIPIVALKLHCLDKQRVREAILRHCEWGVQEDLFEELGL